MNRKLVRQHYTEYGIREWGRLTRSSYRQLEFDTTIYFLKKYLPRKGLVLDAGGGPGRYSIELAKLGYTVILLDLTPKQLQIAKNKIRKEELERKVKQIIEGSIDDLSIRDSGDYRGGYGFTPCHFYLPEELKNSIEKRKIKVLEMIGLEGLSSWHPRETNRLSKKQPKAWKIWLETHYKTCTRPSVVGLSEHFMIIGKQ